MRAENQTTGRLLGYVEVQVASRKFSLRVEALPPKSAEGAERREPGFFSYGNDSYGIFVDGDAPQSVVEQTIERASTDATKHIAQKVLN